MKPKRRFFPAVPLVMFLLLLFFPPAACFAKKAVPALSAEELQEFARARERYLDAGNQSILNAMGWTLIHCDAGEELAKAEDKIQSLFVLESGDEAELARMGGMKALKKNHAELLKSGSPCVRAYGAIALGVIGDPAYAKEIAGLLKDKGAAYPDEEDDFGANLDCDRAAMALGLLGAREYRPELVKLLSSKDSGNRAGAALGLGYMKALENSGEVLALAQNREEDEDVRVAALWSLAEMRAARHAPAIAELLSGPGYVGTDVKRSACYALAALGAKDQAPKVAALLGERFVRGDAAIALALLDARQYIPDIMKMADGWGDSLDRCDALVALGILGGGECAAKAAEHLHDPRKSVRPYAALALLLAGDREHAREVVALLDNEEVGGFYMPWRMKGETVIVADRYTELRKVAEERFDSLKAAEEAATKH